MSTRDVIWTITLTTGIGLLPHQRATGQCRVNEGAKLTASDAYEGDAFGASVSVSGNVAVVGSRGDDDAGSTSGSAYVYRLDGRTWVEEQKLTASDAAQGDVFGKSVSISGDVILVGASGDDDAGSGSGAAYVYRFDGINWLEEQKLVADDGAEGDTFGRSVSISGDVAVVGAPLDDDAGTTSGSAYVYRFDGSTWAAEQKLTASDGAADDWFGRSVSISGDVAVIGANRDDDAGSNSGSAYVYRFDGSTWVEEQKLTASDAAAGDGFGDSMSISGNVVVVGAPGSDDMGSGSGSAYAYRFDGGMWVEEEKMTASDAAQGDAFGVAVSVSGGVVAVGAIFDDDAGIDSGSAYVYRFDGSTWVEAQKLTPSDAGVYGEFGVSVSVSGDVAVVGAVPGHGAFDGFGFAYVFGVNPVPSDPPCGAIDARQPTAPDGSDIAGWDSIAMTFDDPPGEMNAEDFAVVISPPGDAPTVTDVTVDGNTATVHFDDFIPTKAWTTITHWPTGAVTRIGYLPADVNNDKLSNFIDGFRNPNDVLYLIDVLNGVIDPAPPAYQTDTDRSGETNANDVLRVIDLLNGAGVYDEHLGAELPA